VETNRGRFKKNLPTAQTEPKGKKPRGFMQNECFKGETGGNTNPKAKIEKT